MLRFSTILKRSIIAADVGCPLLLKIIEAIENRVAKDKYLGTEDLRKILQEEILTILAAQEKETDFSFDKNYPNSPHVIMVVGVNGVGKQLQLANLPINLHKEKSGLKAQIPSVLGQSINYKFGQTVLMSL